MKVKHRIAMTSSREGSAYSLVSTTFALDYANEDALIRSAGLKSFNIAILRVSKVTFLYFAASKLKLPDGRWNSGDLVWRNGRVTLG